MNQTPTKNKTNPYKKTGGLDESSPYKKSYPQFLKKAACPFLSSVKKVACPLF
jgi:hypothetical protein